MPDLDVIVPVYNEENSVEELSYRISKSLSKAEVDFTITFVDDYSTDKTAEVIERLVSKTDNKTNGETNGRWKKSVNQVIYEAKYDNGETNGSSVRLLRKKGRQGKAYSILEGARQGSAPYIAMIDGDLQYPPEALPEMYKLSKNHGVVVGNRKNHDTSLLRKIGSKLNILIFERLLLGLKCDTQSGLKVFKREVIDNLKEKDVSPWTLDMPLLVKALQLGHDIGEVDINFAKRISGKSKVNFIRVGFEIAVSAINLKLNGKSVDTIKPANGDPVLGAGFTHKDRRFITHTRLPQNQSAMSTFHSWQIIALFGLISLITAFGLLNPVLTAIVIVGLLSILYFIDLLFNLRILMKSLDIPPEVKIKDDEISSLDEGKLPVYTILCPLYKEANVLPEFIESIKKIDWPKEKLEVILLLEDDDEETLKASKKLNIPSYIKTLVVPHSYPKTKPKACNYGLAHSKGEYVVIYDAEDRPDPFQLKKAYCAFKRLSSDVVCLQSKLNYYNTNHNLLTRLFSAEYSLWFDLILPGLQSIETTIPLGGTSNHFKARSLRYLDAWDAFNVTEDCDLGTRLFRKGFKTAILDSTTYEEANSKLGSWIRQRSRWIKGYLQTYLVHMREPVELFSKHGIHALIFQLVIGMRMVFMVINPILWIATISYFTLNSLVGPALEAIYPAPIFYIAVTSLVFGNFINLYTYMIGCARRSSWGLIKYIFLVPVYWAMASAAAYFAFYQLLFKPHYWEKTKHGLHLEKSKTTLPQVNVTVDLDLSIQKGFLKRFLSVLYWPLSVITNNLVDLAELFAPMDLNTVEPNGKMRILIFNWRDMKHIWAGGAEVYIQEVAKRWVDSGHNVTLFSGWDGKSERDSRVDGVTVIRRGGFYTVYLFAALYYIFRLRGKYDVVLDAENGIPFFTPLYVGIPKLLLIHHIHQDVFREQLIFPLSTFAQFLESKLMPMVYWGQSLVTISKSSKSDILARGWGTERGVETVSPGIDFTKFSKATKTKYPSLVYLGRLKPYKNVDVAIRAFGKIQHNIPEARFTIAGTGESTGSLKKLVNKLGLERAVIFEGRVSDERRAELMSSSWVAIQPSSIEGWGITVIEANASGTPVIASNVRGLRDSVIDGKTGILTSVGNANELSEAIEKVLVDKKLRQRLSEDAYLWSQKFSWRPAAFKFEQLLLRKVRLHRILKGIPVVTEAQVTVRK